VVLVGLALLLLLSLISYDPNDVGNRVATESRPLHNFIGPVGAWIAYGTFNCFGLGAYVLMLVLATIGTLLLLGHEIPWRGKVGAGILLLVASDVLFHVWGLEQLRAKLNLMDAGGLIGEIVGRKFSEPLIGTAGTVIVWGAAYLISLIVLVNLRPSHWVLAAVGITQDVWAKMRGKPKADVHDELVEKERELRLKEREVERELARREREARRLSEPKPEPKFTDYTVPRPAPPAEPAKQPSVVEKLAGKVLPKKSAPPAEPTVAEPPPAALPVPVTAAAPAPPAPPPPPPPKPKKPKPPEPEPGVLGSVGAATGEQYVLPPLDLLERPPEPGQRTVMEDLKASALVLRNTLQEFGLDVETGDVTKGPTVTLFELHPAPGVKVEKISGLSNNIAMTMRAEKVRILAPVPGKGTVGVEVPNSTRTTVYLRDLLESDE
jgi:S-DNA-T family DNA segregation ATPase FtsK/SpoIIIE